MCLLSYFPPNVQPDTSELHCGASSNEDGYGWAIVIPTEDRIMVFKSMDATEAITALKDARERYPEGPALFHSRLTTHGETSEDNCHPFKVKGDPRTVVAHNGILPAEVQPARTPVLKTTQAGITYQVYESHDKRSDTRIFADTLAWQRFPCLDSATTRRKLEAWLGLNNKLVFLTVDPRYDSYAYIFNESLGIWSDSGAWHSNSGYCAARIPAWGSSKSLYGYADSASWSADDDEWYRAYRETRGWEGDRDSADTWPTTLGGTRTRGMSPADYLESVLRGIGGVVNGEVHFYECPFFDHVSALPTVRLLSGYCSPCQSCVLCGCPRRDCDCWFGDGALSAYLTDRVLDLLIDEEESEDASRARRWAQEKGRAPLAITAAPHSDAEAVGVVFEGIES